MSTSMETDRDLIYEYLKLCSEQQNILQKCCDSLATFSASTSLIMLRYFQRDSTQENISTNTQNIPRRYIYSLSPRRSVMHRRRYYPDVPPHNSFSVPSSSFRPPPLPPPPPPTPPPTPPPPPTLTHIPIPTINIPPTRQVLYSRPVTRSMYRSTQAVNSLSSFLNTTVTIRPSFQQIQYATRLLFYSDISMNQFTCPIDLLPFNQNDEILQIKYCGHIFREANLRTHFLESPRCPLCRYDIRDYDSAYNENSNNEENNIS